MPLDSFIDTILCPFRRPRNRSSEEDQQNRGSTGESFQQTHGHFKNARNFVLKNPMIGDIITNTILTGKAVLELLEPYTMPGASMDSSARYPPPTCHPGTRLHIRDNLKSWLYNSRRQWKMIWLHGPAGTGKSAVAQTFAELCAEWRRLGAAYFFSRANNRNKLDTVIPSLVYQLAVTVPEYKSVIATVLADDPQLLTKAPPVQFRKLILEPFSTLQRQHSREPILIILDGLDECEGEDAQLQIIEMITEAMRLNEDLPLLWLICSRPEAHLKHAFSRIADCGREELVIDAECRKDVEQYLRDGIASMKVKYQDIIPPSWPPEHQLRRVIEAVYGLFIFASMILKYVGDPIYADPVGQLDDLTAFLERAQAVGSSNPLAALDLLYMQILGSIPQKIFPTTWRILAHVIYGCKTAHQLDVVQILCNFLQLDQYTFYRALRGLHSVIEIPEPEDAAEARLRFHHTSFQDFLCDPNRSGRFVIDKQKALVDLAKSALFWSKIDLTHFHANEGWDFDQLHNHDTLPGLPWISTATQGFSTTITWFSRSTRWYTFRHLSRADVEGDLLSQIYDFDLRYDTPVGLDDLANWFYKKDPSNTFVRTEPSSPTDFRLLEYFKRVINNGVAKPATFPLCWSRGDEPWTREYIFIGHGTKSVIVWVTRFIHAETYLLNADREPSEKQISRYQKALEVMRWDEATAEKRFKSRYQN